MAGSYLLDTNIVIAILNQEGTFEEQLKENKVYLSSTVLGELYYGARKSTRTSDNLKRIDSFLVGYESLVCDKATAQQYELILVTRDAHFKTITELSVEIW